MRKYLALLLAAMMILALAAGCGNNANEGGNSGKTFKIGMVTDVGGVNDKSFNQTSWEGLQALQASDSRFQVPYLESKTDAD